MKETGIIMSGNRPKLILDGVKTMTRKTWGIEVVNQFPDDWRFIRMEGDLAVFLLLKKHSGTIVSARSRSREIRGEEPNLEFLFKCPYGQAGDRLWVKETWQLRTQAEDNQIIEDWYVLYKDAKTKWVNPPDLWLNKQRHHCFDYWRPSIFMPRWASRITLEITEVRAERVQEISLQDIEAEGIALNPMEQLSYLNDGYQRTKDFMWLWDSLNAKRGYSWKFNPWVWVISFKLVPNGQ